MDITNIGTSTWSQPGADPPPDAVNTFLEDTNKGKLANSIGDLLQLTRSRQARQFVEKPADGAALLSASTPQLKTATMGMGASSREMSPTKGNTAGRRTVRQLSSNPSRNPPPGASYSVQERPPSKVEIDALEEQLSERLRTISDLAKAELQAVETGELYQPHKDALILTRDRILKEFSMDEESFQNELPWMDKLVKCESLKQVCDGVATQLVDMVSVTSTGLGNVLRKLKFTYRQSFEQMKESWVALHDSYIENSEELSSKRVLLESVKSDLSKQRKEMRQKVDEEIQQLTDVFESERQRDKEQLQATEFQVEQMTETLKSLNGIFKTMQADGSAINASDLAFKCQRLEKDVEALTSQCMTLDKVKDELQAVKERCASVEKALNQKDLELQATRIQLTKREEMVASLMEKESLRNSEIEKLQKLVAEQSSQEEMDDFEEPPTSVLCIRCKKSLDDLGNIRAAIYGNNGMSSERIQCESFRILLPNMRGKQPHRTIAWVRYCMRAVIISKLKEDVNLLSIKGEVSRFPQYTYSWFERYAVGKAAIRAHAPQMPLVQQNAEIIQMMDEDRWGLYYGAKALSKDDPEAKLFWSLLDESYGEDGLQFVLYCLSIILSMGGDDLWMQFGNVLQEPNKYGSLVTAFSSIGQTGQEHSTNARGQPTQQAMAAQQAGEQPSRPPVGVHSNENNISLIMGGGKYGAGLGGGAQPVLKLQSGEVVPPMGKARVYVDVKVATDAVKYIMVKAGQSLQVALDAIAALSIIPDYIDPLMIRPGTPSILGANSHDSADDTARTGEPDEPPGDASASAASSAKDPTHICLFTWLRIMLQRFTDDQAHRTASVNTMFEAASIGALTPALPAGHVHGNELIAAHRASATAPSIEYPQFQSVCRTLYPFVSIVECATLFTMAYNEGNKHVTAKSFLKVADSMGLFSRSLRLSPLPLLVEHVPEQYNELFNGVISPRKQEQMKAAQEAAEEEEKKQKELEAAAAAESAGALPEGGAASVVVPAPSAISAAEASKKLVGASEGEALPIAYYNDAATIRMRVGCLVHRRMATTVTGLKRLINDLPEKWRVMLTELYHQANDALNEYKQVGKGFRGKKQDFGLMTHHHNHNRNASAGGGAITPPTSLMGGIAPGQVAAKPLISLHHSLYLDGIQPLVQYRKLLSIALVVKALNDNPLLPDGLLTNSTSNILPRLSVNLVKTDRMLDHLEGALYVDMLDSKRFNFDKARHKIVVRKLQNVYRAFVASNPPVPRAVRSFMRPGYLRATESNQIKKRGVIQDPWWCQTLIAEILNFKLMYDIKASRLGHEHITIPSAVTACLYHKFGCLDVSERTVHDLFVCIRAYHYCLPRLRIFGAFVGVGSLDEPVASVMQSKEAIALYLDLLIRTHHEIDLNNRVRLRDTRQTARDMASYKSTGGEVDDADMNINMNEEVCGYSRVLGMFQIHTLFPSSEKDPIVSNERKDAWAVEATVLEQAAVKWAASNCLKSSVGGTGAATGASNDSAAFGQLVYKLKIDRNRCADVDDFLCLLVLHWARVTTLYTKKSSVKATWIERNKGQLVVKGTVQTLPVVPLGSQSLTDNFQAVYGPTGFITDNFHASKVYVDYACARNRKIDTIEKVMHQCTLWDVAIGGGGISSFGAYAASAAAAAVSGEPTQSNSKYSRRHSSVAELAKKIIPPEHDHVHDCYMHQLGYDHEVIGIFQQYHDDILPHKLMINVHTPAAVPLVIGVARKNFSSYHTAINEMMVNVGKLNHELKTEVERMSHAIRKSILHLETLLEAAQPNSAGVESIDTSRSVWAALAAVHGSIDELMLLTGMQYPADPSQATRKLHLERSSVFSIQTTVAGVA